MTDETRNNESYEKQFCLMAIQKGYITLPELMRALAIQAREDIVDGSHRSFREIFLDQEMMSPHQIEAMVKAVIRLAVLVPGDRQPEKIARCRLCFEANPEGLESCQAHGRHQNQFDGDRRGSRLLVPEDQIGRP